ncbi:MAG: ATP-binding protein [Pseudomonadota bacterium]
MIGIPFREIFPKGLYARSVLLTLLPVVIILILMTLYYYNGHLRSVNTRLSQALARDVLLIDEICQRDPAGALSKAQIQTSLGLQFDCRFDRSAADETALTDQFFYQWIVQREVEARLGQPVSVNLDPAEDTLDIQIESPDGVRRIVTDRKRAIAINGHIFIVWVVLFSLFMVFAALAFLRNHVRSILRLTEAAQSFGRGRDVDGYRPHGAREVRAAALAVMQMRQRLIRFAEQRTRMLAGISHDLRTPITRLGLHLAMQDQTEDVRAARADLDEMKVMLDEYLAFVRGEEGESTEAVELHSLLGEIAAGHPATSVRLVDGAPTTIMAKPIALKRALSNIVSNAVAYAPYTEISVDDSPRTVTIRVDDNGPGIPPEKFEEALRPFSRLNEARNQNVPGTGLGLALARDTARRAGGQLTLRTSPLGGLQVEMMLPY